ncbi:MAG TPA: hypothetical protein VFB07_08370 [Vicinamibacterales bacterium]|nr:hypothetical protein [Vicinamibacterales bacterium]
MQQRQLRLGDTLDDYCPRERRLTNHVIVAMVGDDVKQVRCATCDSDHEFKHAKIPRQRRKSESPAALYAQVAAGAPKRIAHESPGDEHDDAADSPLGEDPVEPMEPPPVAAAPDAADHDPSSSDAPYDEDENRPDEEGPAHRRLIRAALPRPEGQQPPARPIPEFTIRQPGGRPNRFRPRHARGGGQGPFSNRSTGNFGGSMRGGGNQRQHGQHNMRSGRKRSK